MERLSSGARRIAGGLLVVAAAAQPATAQHAFKFDHSASKIVIEGNSNLHKWTCATSTFDATVGAPQSPAADLGKSLTALTVTIPVNSLDCGHGDMNNNLRKAMHADKYPTIRYRMTSYSESPKGNSYEADIHGVLTIDGVDRPEEVHATITPTGANGVSAVGSAPVKTTDFGVKPVSVLLGTLRTSPDVTITFRVTASRQ